MLTESLVIAYRDIVRIVAEADNSDMSICYQLCNVRWYGGETDAEEMEMRHDAPCVVERARVLLAESPEVKRMEELLKQRSVALSILHQVYDLGIDVQNEHMSARARALLADAAGV